MQGVEVAPAVNDENASQLFGPATAFKDSSALQQATKSAFKPTGRRAFGNITNAQPLAQPQEAAKQQPGTVKRRAFGDITNSTSKLLNSAAQKPAASQLKPSSTKAKPVAVSEPAAVPTVPWWETAEPEKPAGKTWEQLLADRERQEDAEIEQSVQQLLAGFRNLASRCLQVQQDGSSEEEEVLRPPPLPSSISDPTAASAASSPAVPPITFSSVNFAVEDSSTSNDIDRLLDLLPDVELPWPDEEPAAAAAAAVAVAAAAAGVPDAADGGSSGCSSDFSATACVGSGAQERQHRTGQHWLGSEVAQHHHGNGSGSCSSPGRCQSAAAPGCPAGLRSPEPLPW